MEEPIAWTMDYVTGEWPEDDVVVVCQRCGNRDPRYQAPTLSERVVCLACALSFIPGPVAADSLPPYTYAIDPGPPDADRGDVMDVIYGQVLLGFEDPTQEDPAHRLDLECHPDRLVLNGEEPTDAQVVDFLKRLAAHYADRRAEVT